MQNQFTVFSSKGMAQINVRIELSHFFLPDLQTLQQHIGQAEKNVQHFGLQKLKERIIKGEIYVARTQNIKLAYLPAGWWWIIGCLPACACLLACCFSVDDGWFGVLFPETAGSNLSIQPCVCLYWCMCVGRYVCCYFLIKPLKWRCFIRHARVLAKVGAWFLCERLA